MKHAKLTELTITAQHCGSEHELHSFISEALSFPDYYGGNLSALADCLSDLCEPTLITINIDAEDIEPGMQAYLLRFTQVCARESLVNENLSLIVEHTNL